MMDIHAISKQLDAQFPEYVVKLKCVPEEDSLISVNVFGVPRDDFHAVKEAIFDLEESYSGGEIFIPICYTKQELLEHYPAIAEEYSVKQKILLKKKESNLISAALQDFEPQRCPCPQKHVPLVTEWTGFASCSPEWSANRSCSFSAAEESYGLAA